MAKSSGNAKKTTQPDIRACLTRSENAVRVTRSMTRTSQSSASHDEASISTISETPPYDPPSLELLSSAPSPPTKYPSSRVEILDSGEIPPIEQNHTMGAGFQEDTGAQSTFPPNHVVDALVADQTLSRTPVIAAWKKRGPGDTSFVAHPRRPEHLHTFPNADALLNIQGITRIATCEELRRFAPDINAVRTFRYHLSNVKRGIVKRDILEALRHSLPSAEFIHVDLPRGSPRMNKPATRSAKQYAFADCLNALHEDENTVEIGGLQVVITPARSNTRRNTSTIRSGPKPNDLRLRVDHSRSISKHAWETFCDGIQNESKHIRQAYGLQTGGQVSSGFSFLFFNNRENLIQAYRILRRSSQFHPLWPIHLPRPEEEDIELPYTKLIAQETFRKAARHILRPLLSATHMPQDDWEVLQLAAIHQITQAFEETIAQHMQNPSQQSPRPSSLGRGSP